MVVGGAKGGGGLFGWKVRSEGCSPSDSRPCPSASKLQPPSLAAVQAMLLERLGQGGLPEEAAVAAVRQLGELGEWPSAPALAAALHESEEVAATAEEALWQLFLK